MHRARQRLRVYRRRRLRRLDRRLVLLRRLALGRRMRRLQARLQAWHQYRASVRQTSVLSALHQALLPSMVSVLAQGATQSDQSLPALPSRALPRLTFVPLVLRLALPLLLAWVLLILAA